VKYSKSDGQTHWEGCWREHHACAVAEIERLLEVIDLCEIKVRNVMANVNEMHRALAREVKFP
jgi:hypothetical protein